MLKTKPWKELTKAEQKAELKKRDERRLALKQLEEIKRLEKHGFKLSFGYAKLEIKAELYREEALAAMAAEVVEEVANESAPAV